MRLALTLSITLAASTAFAQRGAPWASRVPDPSAPVAPAGVVEAPIEPYARTPDAGQTHTFQMPSARPMNQGDTMAVAAGALGWAAIRYGFHRRFDAGVGVPYFLVGVAADARVALVLERNVAFSLYANVQVSAHPGGGSPLAFLGFTWSGVGALWMAGPVLTLWGERASVTVGVNAVQRVRVGGLWTMPNVTADVRLIDGIKAIAQAVLIAETLSENAGMTERRALLGNAQPRVLLYGVVGVRFYARRSALDVGALAVLGENVPLSYGPVSVWPWLSAAHYW